jgi:autotransporter passenger strand-loop-strand repeat protein
MSIFSRLLELAGVLSWGWKGGSGRRRPTLRRPIRRSAPALEGLEERLVPTLMGQQLFPSDNPWNQNIANAPVAANSASIIANIGASTRLTPNWGAADPTSSNPLYGMPINIVHGNSTARVNVIIDNYPGESDLVSVPIPTNAVIEGDFQNGPNMNGGGYNAGQRGDSHLIVWDEDTNTAYELYGVSRPNDPTLFPNTSFVELPKTDTAWHAAQETVWNMNTDTFRTLGATSADAAGLSILAGLARPDEALPVSQGGQGTINHALRVTLPGGEVNPQYVYPASHVVSESQASNKIPLGGRLRLEDTPAIDALISNMPPESQALARAMQQYGLIVADIGSAMYVSGASSLTDTVDTPNTNLTWNLNDIFAANGLESLNAGDFQVVDLTPRVTGLSASSGTPGSTITITGQNFSGAAGHLSVLFGTTASTSVNVLSDTQVTAVVPNGSGTVDVTVQSGVNETDNISSNPNANVNAPIFGYGTSATSPADRFTFGTSAVTLQSISVTPANPSATVGNSVTFTATGIFSDNSTEVLTGGVTWASSSTAVATIDSTGKATAVTAGPTTITANVGGVSGSTTLTVTPAAVAPTVTHVDPATGPATGGTTVTITGTGFTGVTGVSFGGRAATSFTVVSPTKITARAPAGTVGQAVDISVTTSGGTSATSTADRFSYTAVTFPPPSNLRVTPGNGSVTFSFDRPTSPVNYYPYAELIGSTLYPIYVGFSDPFTITANNQGPLVNGTTHTFEMAITYANGHTSAWSSPITVTIGGTGTAAPTVTHVDPASGPTAGGTTVTITGTGFTGATGVSFGGTAATSFNVVSATQITAKAPAGTAGTVDLTVATAAGTSATSTADRFSYVAAPTITTQPTAVTVSAGQPATFTVAAAGTGSLTYQWQKFIGGNWVNVSTSNTSAFTGATSPTFTITSPQTSDAGTYWVVVTNAGGSVDSSAVSLTVNAVPVAPTVTTNPTSQTVAAGSSVTFISAASGTPTPTVQWQVSTGGAFTNIAGATSPTYTFTATASMNGYRFQAVFTNSAGTATTSAATLTTTTTTGITLANGQQMVVDAGQTVTGVTVLPGGYLLVLAGGTDVGSVIEGGDETVEAGGHTVGTTITGTGGVDGDIEIFGTADGLILDAGYINVDQGGTVNNTTINGDIMYVSGGGTANNTTIFAGGSTTIIGGGVDNGTVLDGGTEWVRSGAVSNGTTVNNGGIEYTFLGGLSNNLTVNNGGSVTMLGTVIGATINSGGAITVYDGGSATGAILDNGTLAFALNGTNTFAAQLTGNGVLSVQGTGKLVVSNALNSNVGVNIGNSSSLELAAAANANIVFGYQSTLKLDDSQGFTGTLTATPGYLDVIDLGDVPFVAGVTTVQFVENAAHTQGVLTVSDQAGGGPTVQLTLLGDFSTGVFSIATDGQAGPHPGTLVTGPF